MHDTAMHDTVELLQTLLSAERAGSRVAAESLQQGGTPEQLALLARVLKGEGDSCLHLLSCLRHLGVEPNRETSDFHPRAMAIADLAERLAFVERGQQWVIRKLEGFLPACTDTVLQRELAVVLQIHRDNSQG